MRAMARRYHRCQQPADVQGSLRQHLFAGCQLRLRPARSDIVLALRQRCRARHRQYLRRLWPIDRCNHEHGWHQPHAELPLRPQWQPHANHSSRPLVLPVRLRWCESDGQPQRIYRGIRLGWGHVSAHHRLPKRWWPLAYLSSIWSDHYLNAVAESFFSTLKNEQTLHDRYHTRAQARAAIFEFIELFYNPVRQHSHLNGLSPMEFEREARG